MRDAEYRDPDFIQTVMGLFDKGKTIREIAFLTETDYETINTIVCDELAKDMVEDVMKDFEPKC